MMSPCFNKYYQYLFLFSISLRIVMPFMDSSYFYVLSSTKNQL